MNDPDMRTAAPFGRLRGPAPRGIDLEALALIASLYLTAVGNVAMWRQVFADRSWAEPGTWRFAVCLFVGLTALQFVFIAAVLTRRTAHATVAVLLLVTALASHYIGKYHVLLDASMLRNVLHTDVAEAGELLSPSLLWQIGWQALLPALLLWRIPLVRRRWPRALLQRAAALAAGGGVVVIAVMSASQDFASVARNHREWRFLVTPANVVAGAVAVGRADLRGAAAPRAPIGTDARWQPAAGAPAGLKPVKPVLLVLVVGETARAADWQLSGAARPTTPELAALGVTSFTDVTSCGTNTEVSLPCMFSPWGRRDYDEDRIRGHQSLLHLLDRAGIDVLWRDNQSGCKGVCDGLPTERLDALTTPGLCEDGRCFDAILLEGLEAPGGWLAQPPAGGRPRLLVLHQIGSHGPAYHRRVPPAFRRFLPTCDSAELHECTPAQIVNSYDNTLLYTDHVLAETVRLLQRHTADYDSLLVYVSDHGESLGEHGLYLHGMPYAIAPKEQTQVPMLMWFSAGWRARAGLDARCIEERAARPASHDHLFHTVLGALDVQTAVYEPAFDLLATCRRPLAAVDGTH